MKKFCGCGVFLWVLVGLCSVLVFVFQVVGGVEGVGVVWVFWCIVFWYFVGGWWSQVFVVFGWIGFVGMQCSQQVLVGLFVQGQVLGVVGEVFLYVLVVLGQFFYEVGGGVEMGYDFVLIVVEVVLQVVYLVLYFVWCGVGQQVGDQKIDGDFGDQGEGWQQLGGE